jgi:hypothetical protein
LAKKFVELHGGGRIKLDAKQVDGVVEISVSDTIAAFSNSLVPFNPRGLFS